MVIVVVADADAVECVTPSGAAMMTRSPHA